MRSRHARGVAGCVLALLVLPVGPSATASSQVAPEPPTIDSAPPNVSSENGATFTFSGEPGASFECRLDDGAYSACTSPKSYAGLTDNAHVFEVKAANASLEESGAATYIWRVDVPPAVALQRQSIGTFTNPIFVTAPPDDSNRVFVVERAGRIMIVKDGVKLTTPFLDISADVSTNGERGLLSMAFAPDYPATGRFYIFYTRTGAAGTVGDEVLEEIQRSAANPDLADPATRRVVLLQEHSSDAYHNGGQLQYGPDGYLYLSLGDGFDNPDNAQSLTNWLGKILRIDPRQSGPDPYSIPSDNPFAGGEAVDDPIYIYGLRNPWRFSFDRNTGDIIPTDVGESTREEVDFFKPDTSASGANLGWPCWEGSLRYDTSCNPANHTPPVLQKNHGGDSFCAIAGGYVVRDLSLSAYGRYLYGDYCQPNLRTAILQLPAATDDQAAGVSVDSMPSLGEDWCGRVYAMELLGVGSNVFRFEQPDAATCQPPSLSVADASVSEGNSGTTDAAFTLTLSAARAVPVTVEYATQDATASAGADYQERSGELTFAPGERRKTVVIPVNGDTAAEPTETFDLVLSRAGNAALADPVGVGTITDNDLPSLSISDTSVTEGNSGNTSASFTISLSSPSAAQATVNWATTAGTAVPGTDYQAASGTATFAPGDTSETLSVDVIGDQVTEPNETFFVDLTGPSTATIADDRGIGTILDDDGSNSPPVAVNDSLTTPEDVSGNVNVLANDSDPNGDPLAVSASTDPAHGTVSCAPAGVCTYLGNANYNGPDSFTYTVSDGRGGTANGTVGVNVTSVNDPPHPHDDFPTVDEDGVVTFDVLENEIGHDDDGGTVAFDSLVAQPVNGSVSCTPAGVCTYTPKPNFNGADPFGYRANDGQGGVASATVHLAVNPVNDAPVAADRSTSTAEDTAKTVALSATDVDGDALTYSITDPPDHGALTGTGASRTYTPAADYNGPDAFTFSASDGTASDTGTISITVTPVDDAPVAQDASAATAEDTAKVLTLAATDADGDALTYAITDAPDHGTLSGTGTTRTYTPAVNYHGSDAFTFSASDGTASDAGTFSLTVTPVNDAPVAVDSTAATTQNSSANIALQASDVDGDTLAYAITAPPGHGAVNCTGASCMYTPATDYIGPDVFTFQASDGTASDTAAVSITVAAVGVVPDAQDDSITTAEDTPVGVTLRAPESEGDTVTFTVVDPPGHGGVSCTGPSCTYTPTANYNGPDAFLFRASDPDGSDTATISITVTAVNDAPVAADATTSTAEDTAKAITLAATDVDGDALTYAITDQPDHGTLTGTGSARSYTPAANYNGPDSFVFSASDGAASDPGTVSLTVTPVNDAPVLDTSGAPFLTAVPEGATDPAGDTIPQLLARGAGGDPISDVDTGAVEGIAVVTADAASGTWQYRIGTANPWQPLGAVSASNARLLNSTTNTTIRFVPSGAFDGAATMQFRAWDRTTGSNGGLANPGAGGGSSAFSSAVEPATVDVLGVNQAPAAADGAATTPEDVAKGITLVATDADGDAIAYAVTDPPDHGTLTGTGASRTYTPALDYNGADSFTFSASDGTASDTATISIAVTPVNDAPAVADDALSTREGTAAAVNVLGNDADVDGDALRVTTAAPQAAHGTVSCTDSGTCTYAPAAGFGGGDSFAYSVADGHGGSDEGVVAVTVSPIARPAVRVDPVSVVEGDSGTADAVFSVALSFPAPLAASVRFATSDVTAAAGGDYTPANGVLSFAPGEVRKLVVVKVVGDPADEPNESFALRLSEPVNMSLAVAEAAGTIVDDDRPAAGPAVRIGVRTATATPNGLVPLRLVAPAGARGTVTGALALDALVDARVLSSLQKARRLRLGSTTFRLRPGQRRTIQVRLSKPGRKVLRRLRRVRVQVVVTARDASGKRRTTRGTLLLRAPRRR